jgi:hypothetical protein
MSPETVLLESKKEGVTTLTAVVGLIGISATVSNSFIAGMGFPKRFPAKDLISALFTAIIPAAKSVPHSKNINITLIAASAKLTGPLLILFPQ